ncbi:alpha/beta hydrolase [Ferdinandcohnia sp. SAFN-114]|uniref:alpha/beta hydrolase n=1 Tax=Ferdinandcohnia sp. SAFN-114 TaxID=3387275 RepID=UPI003F7D0FDB
MNKSNRTFYSSHLNKTLDYMVLTLSENIEDAYLLYVQDGRDYIELGGLEDAIQDLVSANPELANHLVLVLIHPGDSIERWESFSRTGAFFHQYLRFMNDEFIPEFERNLGVSVSRRGLLGDSLAGNISINIALEKPESWTHLLLQSPAISDGDIERVEEVDFAGWNVLQTVGTYEDEFVSSISDQKLLILTRNRELYRSFTTKNINVQYIETEDEHLWKVWERDLPRALDFFCWDWSTAPVKEV